MNEVNLFKRYCMKLLNPSPWNDGPGAQRRGSSARLSGTPDGVLITGRPCNEHGAGDAPDAGFPDVFPVPRPSWVLGWERHRFPHHAERNMKV